jgi:hypothetical protein
LKDYVGDLLDDPDIDVITTRHPDHTTAEYEQLGVDWLLQSAWPGDGWLTELRHNIGLDS